LLASAHARAPQTWNRYTYVLNNPLNNIDPLGLACAPDSAACPGSPPPDDAIQDQKKEEQKKKIPLPTRDEVEIVDLPRDQDLYQLRTVGYTPVVFNGEPIKDENGQILEEGGVRYDTAYGFGVELQYQLKPGQDFPTPDPGTEVTLTEHVTGTLGGQATKPFDRTITLNKDLKGGDFVGLVNRSDTSGPKDVRVAHQSLTVNATIGGQAQHFVIRENSIRMDPNAKVKIKITEIPISEP
jgi:uncharacterized protein RhaS with RHS repeats